MIAYDLQCGNGHRFEGWFEDSSAFDQQKKQGLIICPICEDTDINRLPSAFSIKSPSTSALPVAPTEPPMGEDDIRKIEALGKQISDYVENNFDNVGADFAEEALKMHYGAAEPRNIRGVSTPQEEETLKAEGIHFFKVPVSEKSSSDTDPDAS